MRKRKAYLYCGVFFAGGGLIISVAVMVALMTGVVTHLLLSPALWRIPFALLIISGLFIVASIVMLVMGLTMRTEKQP